MTDHKDHAALAPYVDAIRKFCLHSHQDQLTPEITQAAIKAAASILVFFQAGGPQYFSAAEVRARLAYRGHKLNVGTIRHLLHWGAGLLRYVRAGDERPINVRIDARPGRFGFYFAARCPGSGLTPAFDPTSKLEPKTLMANGIDIVAPKLNFALSVTDNGHAQYTATQNLCDYTVVRKPNGEGWIAGVRTASGRFFWLDGFGTITEGLWGAGVFAGPKDAMKIAQRHAEKS